MTRVVHKFGIHPDDPPVMISGRNPKVVMLGFQRGKPYVWIEHDPDDGLQRALDFLVLATGENVPEGRVHIGSIGLDSMDYAPIAFHPNEFVFHVYLPHDTFLWVRA